MEIKGRSVTELQVLLREYVDVLNWYCTHMPPGPPNESMDVYHPQTKKSHGHATIMAK
jgi:hypothetical protein